MSGKMYAVAFVHEEKGSNAIADSFNFDKLRDEELGTALVNRLIESAKNAKPETALTVSAIVMDFFADLAPEEQGPFMATAMVAYYSERFMQRMMQARAEAAMRDFLERMQGGSSGPG